MDNFVHSLCGQFNSPVGADPPDLVFGYPFYRLGRGGKDGGDENDSGCGSVGGGGGVGGGGDVGGVSSFFTGSVG